MSEEDLPPCQQTRPGKIDFGTDCEYTCDYCDGYGRSNPYDRLRQLLIHKRNSFTCTLCGAYYYSDVTLNRHSLIKHGCLPQPSASASAEGKPSSSGAKSPLSTPESPTLEEKSPTAPCVEEKEPDS
jgi:hypothetical protein